MHSLEFCMRETEGLGCMSKFKKLFLKLGAQDER